jgi:predicted O-methyltransferase YrrM
MLTVIGFFDKPDFKTHILMRSLEAEFGAVRFIVVFDNLDVNGQFDFEKLTELSIISKLELVEAISHHYFFDFSFLNGIAEAYKPLYKILLALYCRKLLDIDYCIMTDNDIIIFEPIPEIYQLAISKQTFLIQEPGNTYQIPDISNLIRKCFDRDDTSPVPNKGKGYNIGFCGLDLRMYDILEKKSFSALMYLISRLDVWWKEQAFVVSMIFSFSKNVHTFDNEKYLFLWHNDPRYRLRSKVYHCIGTSEKSSIDRYYAQNEVAHLITTVVGGFSFGIGITLSLLRRLKRYLYRFLFNIVEPNANRYRHLLEYLKMTSCERILEIGVWRGDTSKQMIRSSKNRQVEYHGIDVFEESTADLVQKEVSLVADQMEDVLYNLRKISKKTFLHRGSSEDVFPKLYNLGLMFDCIWIDGGHSYKTVKFDFENYSRLLNKEGVIFIDDYSNDSVLSDVKRYVDDELMSDIRFEVTVHDQWIDYYRGYSYKVVSVKFR